MLYFLAQRCVLTILTCYYLTRMPLKLSFFKHAQTKAAKMQPFSSFKDFIRCSDNSGLLRISIRKKCGGKHLVYYAALCFPVLTKMGKLS